MKKKILSVSSFSIILVLLLYLVSVFFSSFNYYSVKMTNEPEDTIDYLVIGDSETYTSISPMQIYGEQGYTGFNIGTPGQNLQNTYFSLVDGLREQSPKYVFLEMNSTFKRSNFLAMNQFFINYALGDIFSITKTHDLWKSMVRTGFKEDAKNLEDLSAKNWKKGFVINDMVRPFTGSEYMIPTTEEIPLTSFQEEYLNMIIEICKEAGVQLVFYSAVSPKNWNYKFHNKVESIAKENGLDYIDFNTMTQELNYDYINYTYDYGDHVNFQGATIISSYIGEYLKNENQLVDKRQVQQYNYWNTALKEYELHKPVK